MSFQKGTIIVRDDRSYPEGALVVDGYRTNGSLLAHAMGGGFQLIIPVRNQSRFRIVPPAERVPVYRAGLFTIEGVEGVYHGWTDGSLWNGWAMPRFEHSEAQRLIAAFGEDAGYNPEQDAFLTGTGEEPDVWKAERITLPGGEEVTVYPIGAGCWVWEEAEQAPGCHG